MLRFGSTTRARVCAAPQPLMQMAPPSSRASVTKVWTMGVVAALAMAALILPAAAGAAVTCDVSVSSASALDSAVGSTANSGRTICVTASTGGSHTWTVDQAAMTTVIAQPADKTIDMGPITFSGAKNITVTGFEFTSGAFAVNCCSATTSVHMDGNYIHGFSGDGLDLYSQAAMTDIQFTHNRVECLTGNGDGGNGYGIRTYGGPYTAPKFNYNTIVGCGNTGDGMEIGSLENFEVIGNVITGMGGPANQHADALMIWAGSRNGVIKDNRILDGPGTLISPDGSDLLIENNLIARHNFPTGSDQCIDATPNGTSGSIVPTRWTMRRNTVWTCGNGGLNVTGPLTSGHGGNVLDRNVFTEVRCATSAIFTSTDHNLTGGGCTLPGTNNTNFSPSFVNTVDYLPTNLPAGYETAGYRSAPAGYLAGTVTPPADTTAPDTTITSGPADPTTSTSASFAFTSSESGSTFECKVDAGAYGACTNPKAYSNQTVATHMMSVRATDAAANTDASPATKTWTVTAPAADTTPPDTTITSGPRGSTTSTSASVAFTSTESGSFECQLDAGAFGACTSPKTYSGLSVASHTVSVRAIDAASNVDASPATRTWTVTAPAADTTPPDTTITSGPSGSTTATSASVAFTSNESGSTFECSLDAGAYGVCTSPKAYSGLSVGSHTVSVRAIDAASNTDASPATSSWTVTVGAPGVTPPTLVSESETSWTTATSSKSLTYSVQAGDTIVAYAMSGDSSDPLAISGGPTWTRRQAVLFSSYAPVYVWTATAATAGTLTTAVRRTAGGDAYGFDVLVFRGSTGIGVSAQARASSGAPAVTLAPSAHSAVVVANADWTAKSGTALWRTGAGALTATTSAFLSGAYTVYGGYHANVTGGSSTFGLSAPTGQKFSIAAVEVKGA
jgi:Right handed beta helix region